MEGLGSTLWKGFWSKGTRGRPGICPEWVEPVGYDGAVFPLLLILTRPASAATLEVPASYASVQDAIAAAAPGDTIQIASGTFNGEVLVDKDVTLVGSGMNDTILFSSTGEFTLAAAAGVTTTLSDLTVSGSDTRVAANADTGSDITLTNVKLRSGYSSTRWGAAMRVFSATVTIRDSVICGNASDGVPAGLFVHESSSLDVSGSVFFDSAANFDGGAAYVRGDAVLTNNTFYGTSADRGAAVYASSLADVTVTNNIVAATRTTGAYSGFAVESETLAVAGGNNLYFDNLDDHTNAPLANDVLDQDPLLLNPTVTCRDATLLDFGLAAGSPAIDAGDARGLCDDIGALPFVDLDGDGFGLGEDCDDGDLYTYPGATEVLADGVDQDCDGMENCYYDSDEDGDRSETITYGSDSVGCDGPNDALASQPVDCDDADPLRNSGFPELPCDGVDNDCDPTTPDDTGGCDTGTGDADTDTDVDADTDADVDADTDADVDTDADADTDTDVDADTDAETGDTGLPDAVAGGSAVDGCACRYGGRPWSSTLWELLRRR